MWPYWVIYCTLGNFLKPVATIISPKSPTFIGNFCKGGKIFQFFTEIIYQATFIDIWRFLLVTMHSINLTLHVGNQFPCRLLSSSASSLATLLLAARPTSRDAVPQTCAGIREGRRWTSASPSGWSWSRFDRSDSGAKICVDSECLIIRNVS